MGWMVAAVVAVVLIVTSAPYWTTFWDSLTGSDDDYESRIEARSGHVPPRSRPSEEELRADFKRLAAEGSCAADIARTYDP